MPAREPSAIADAIVRVGRDEALRSALVANARRAVRRYSWDRVTGEILEVYEEAVSGARARGTSGGEEEGSESRPVERPVGAGAHGNRLLVRCLHTAGATPSRII